MAYTPDITVRVLFDPRRLNAQVAHVGYAFARLTHAAVHANDARTVDTPSITDARDLAYTRTDAAQGPAPWEVTR